MPMNNKGLLDRARELRKNPTPQENMLWYKFLRDQSGHFRRQKIMGRYIVDFYSADLKVVIEIDGSQHFEETALEYDKTRTEYLERNFGVKVIRVDNHQINTNFTGVCDYLLEIINGIST